MTPIDSVLTDATASNAALAACRAAAAGTGVGSCPQGISDETVNSGGGRLTLQVNSKNKLGLYLDRIHKDRASDQSANSDQRITGVHWDSPMYMTNSAKWTSTVSSRLLIQGGWSSNIERYNNKYQTGIEQPLYSALWYSMASRTLDGIRSVSGPTEYGSYPDRYNWQGSAAYVTGTHNVSLGFQDSFGTYNQRYYGNGDMYAVSLTTNGVPTASSATVGATAPWFDDRLNASLGIYAGDNWTMKRLTLNYGLRWDYLLESVVGQPTQQGTFAVIPAYGDKNMPTQTNWEPHVSIIYDLTGTGKTAIRAGYNRYVNGATTSPRRGPGSRREPDGRAEVERRQRRWHRAVSGHARHRRTPDLELRWQPGYDGVRSERWMRAGLLRGVEHLRRDGDQQRAGSESQAALPEQDQRRRLS